jgi:serine/threonine protein phosphatase PrpC
MRLRVDLASERGAERENNEDSLGYPARTIHGALSFADTIRLELGGKTAAFCVADGMGGHEAGEVASRIAVETVIEGSSKVSTAKEFASLILEANDLIVDAGRSDVTKRSSMGTTIAAVIIAQGSCLWANVGDSQIYATKSGKLEQISIDDIPPGMTKSHAITQCLGGVPPRSIQPHAGQIDLGDIESLVLVSDGISDVLDPAAIGQIMTGKFPNRAIALCRTALDAESGDDRSAVAITFVREDG